MFSGRMGDMVVKIPKNIRSDFSGGERGWRSWGGPRKPQLLEPTSVFKKNNNIRQQGMAPLGVGLLCFMVSEKRYNLPLQKIQFWCGFKLMVVSETSLIVMSQGHKKWPDGGNSHIFDFSPRKFWGRWTEANLRRSYFSDGWGRNHQPEDGAP